jgi:HlyD family secretion protein
MVVMGGPAGATPSASARRSGPSVAVVKTAKGYEPRVVRLGISDFEYTEVLSGLEAGDQVILLGAVEQQAQRDEMKNRMRQRTGGGITTSTTTTTTNRGGAAGGGGTGGGQRGGGR